MGGFEIIYATLLTTHWLFFLGSFPETGFHFSLRLNFWLFYLKKNYAWSRHTISQKLVNKRSMFN